MEPPAHYRIETLLSQTVQPFPDMTPEALEELRLSIKTTGLQDPVSLTEDGSTLFDGHQRLMALLALGRKRIDAKDVRLVPGVTRENAWERSVAKNSIRRHLTSQDKAMAMHRCAGHGWSQRKIARAFGMSQPGVSKLMATYPATEDIPTSDVTEGDDGKFYERKEPDKREPVHPWAPGGDVGKAFRKTWSAMTGWSPATVRAELTDRQWSEVNELISQSYHCAGEWLDDPAWLEGDES